jgi:Tfp pilus assembly protein PilE
VISNEKGFAVIEIIITVLLISIITIIVLPSKNIVERLELKAQAKSLATNIRYTQKQAMCISTDYVLKIITKDNLYIVRKATDLRGSEKKVYIPHKFRFSDSSTINFKYTSKGTPCDPDDATGRRGAGGTIYLLSNHFSIKITIEPTTGRVRVYDITKI